MRDPYHPAMDRPWRGWLPTRTRMAAHHMLDAGVAPLPELAVHYTFVVGCGHSGTTLLAAALGRHSDVLTIGHESEAFLPANGLRCARQQAQSWADLARQQQRALLVEKTPKHVLTLTRIWRLIPEARVLCLIRDGRDVVASLRARFGHLDRAMDRWITDNAPVPRLYWDDRVRTVRYEDLTERPEATIQAVCDFLGIAREPAMLAGGASPYDQQASGNMALRAEQVRQPIAPPATPRRAELTPEELARFWRRCGPTMAALGYGAGEASPYPG